MQKKCKRSQCEENSYGQAPLCVRHAEHFLEASLMICWALIMECAILVPMPFILGAKFWHYPMFWFLSTIVAIIFGMGLLRLPIWPFDKITNALYPRGNLRPDNGQGAQ